METREQAQSQEINLLDLLHVLVKRKMLIIKTCGFCLVASVIYSLTLPNMYAATAKILPPQKESGGGISALLGQAGGGLASIAAGGLSGGSDLYIGILKSRSVNDAVIERLGLLKVYRENSFEGARKKLGYAVTLLAGKDGIISITAEDRDPERSAALANTLVDELDKATVRLNLSKAGTERAFLERRLQLVGKDLKAAEDDLKAFAQNNKVVQVDAQAKASIEGVARLKAELASKQVQLAVLRSKQTEESPAVKTLVAATAKLEQEISALAGRNGVSAGIPSVGSVPGLGLEYSRKVRELKTQEAIFEQLTKQYEMAKLNEARDSSSLQILDTAVPPVRKSKPSRALIVSLATVAAFFVSVVIAFVQEYLGMMPERDKNIMNSIKLNALKFR